MSSAYILTSWRMSHNLLIAPTVDSQSESELLYAWRFTASQLVLATSPLRLTTVILISSLTRGCVCRMQLLLVLARVVSFRSESRGTHDHILLAQIRDSPNLGGQVPVFISPRNRVARLYPQTMGSLFVTSTTRRATVEVFDPASTRG
jgi:hypothetical protein